MSGRVELDDVLAHLDPDRRSAFVLTQVLGLQYDEAAEVLDCPSERSGPAWPEPAATWWR